ncbi:MAG TPA: nitroreductase family deazaflavin-dependent oxidoreductase [Acidimicrobiales bacterium]|nr:nitroreductase family deazaflavin-dependent oxidoreductase [Acidimicrobiales bacterium]
MPRRAEIPDPLEYNAATAEEFRANGGRVTGDFEGRPLLLLTTTGARTGAERTSPLIYTMDGDRYVVTAAAGGAPQHPAWYHNLVAEPRVTVEVGSEKFGARAIEPGGEERERLFAERCVATPNFRIYQDKTERRIPIIVLEREAGG